ncbi:MAG: tyrosine-type recombinase/integrase [Sulfitobacter sp.]
MATYRTRKLKSGKTSVTAQIIRRNPAYQESRTFDKESTAKKWAMKREREIDADIKDGVVPKKRSDKVATLGDVMDRYISENRIAMGDTKTQVLRTIRKEYEIAEMQCDRITSPDIVSFASQLWDRPSINSAATVSNYIEHLSAVFSVASSMWGVALDYDEMRKARAVLKKMGQTGKSKERTRRPTLDELDGLMTYFSTASEHDPRAVPMHRLLAFAIFSTRRTGEICRITWDDYEADEGRVMVRDLKHPGDKNGNDTWCDLPDHCAGIITTMPKIDARIFPYHSDTVSRRFTHACKCLGINNLHFHDMRHEGTSRLCEMGWSIQLVANVTGHRSWVSLKRYAHIRQHGDKFEGWKWLEEAS